MMELNRYCEAGEVRGLTAEERRDLKVSLRTFEKYTTASHPFWIHFRGHEGKGEFSPEIDRIMQTVENTYGNRCDIFKYIERENTR